MAGTNERVVTPAELLEAILTVDAGKGGLGRQKAAVNACLAQPAVFGQPELGAALQRLVLRCGLGGGGRGRGGRGGVHACPTHPRPRPAHQRPRPAPLRPPRPPLAHTRASPAPRPLPHSTPLPPLFMRLLIQALAAAPGLRPFAVSLLNQTAARAVWDDARQWQGWLLAARAAAPDAFAALLALPPRVLEAALVGDRAGLRAPLTDYARSAGCPVAVPPDVRAVLDRLDAAARGGG